MVLHSGLHIIIKELLLPFFYDWLELSLQKFLLKCEYQLLFLLLPSSSTLRLSYMLNLILAESEAFIHDLLLQITVSRCEIVVELACYQGSRVTEPAL